MRVPAAIPERGGSTSLTAGFTLPEMLIAAAVFLLLVTGIIGANVFGLRMYQVSENKLKSADAARKAVGKMADEIRTCKTALLGTVSNGVFYGRLNGEVQTGGGLLIYPTTNTSSYILYFVNPSDQSFRRTTSPSGTTVVLAQSVTNTAIFRAEDYLGNVLTNNLNNRVIHLNMQFYQPGKYIRAADYYKLETSVTRRAL